MKIRFPGGQRNLWLFLLVAAGAFGITMYVTPAQPDSGADGLYPDQAPTPALSSGERMDDAEPAPAPVDPSLPASPSDSSVIEWRGYSIPLVELRGLPPDVKPGARIELWASWEPPITDKRRVQKLFAGARVSRVIPPTVAEVPTTVELLVRVDELPVLLFADRHSFLSATVVAP